MEAWKKKEKERETRTARNGDVSTDEESRRKYNFSRYTTKSWR